MRKHFECSECGGKFATGVEFSDHFERVEGGHAIIGCAKKSKKSKNA